MFSTVSGSTPPDREASVVVAAIWLGLRRLTHRVLEKPRADGGD